MHTLAKGGIRQGSQSCSGMVMWLYASVRLSVSLFSNFIYPLNVNAWTCLMQTHHN